MYSFFVLRESGGRHNVHLVQECGPRVPMEKRKQQASPNVLRVTPLQFDSRIVPQDMTERIVDAMFTLKIPGLKTLLEGIYTLSIETGTVLAKQEIADAAAL